MEMSKLNKKTFFIILLSSSLVSCSTFDSLRFWQNDDDIDPDEPKELLSFNEQRNINIEWDISFNGVNDLGSFKPGFSSENLFFADAEGNLISVQSSTGKKLEKTTKFFILRSSIGIRYIGCFRYKRECNCFKSK
jgi:hypothetical protein